MSPAAAALKSDFATQAQPRLEGDIERELFLGLPKADKTLGKSDGDFMDAAGYFAVDKASRIDDYRLIDKSNRSDIGLRVLELKATDLAENISDGCIDTAIIGMDVLREFNQGLRGQKERMNVVPVAALDMAPCGLAVAVREDETVNSIQDLDGRVIVTKYPNSVQNWAAKNRIKFSRIMKRNGGIESYGLLMKGAIIADMVESGGSLAVNGWRILGMEERAWGNIRDGRSKFSDLSMEEMGNISGVITPSRAMLVRSHRRMSPEKEQALVNLAERFMRASSALGNAPYIIEKGVTQQRDFVAGREVRISNASRAGEIGHGVWHAPV